ncbi:MAG: rhodanese-like domain-containing protein [Flavobacteriales bacterium]|nr:rhodanese-like domain-containing protein [Flavobacteriales bacterium]
MKHAFLLAFSSLVLSPCALAQVQAPVQSAAKAAPQELPPSEFQRLAALGTHQLIDVRTPQEFSGGHLAGAINLDWTAADYEAAFSRIDASRPVLLYCHSGGRSEQALEHLVGKGYRVQHLEGGIAAWRKAGLVVVK